MNTWTEEIIEANRLFYEAFSSADMKKMSAIWSQETEVSVVHPGHPMLRGYDRVLASWDQILGAASQFDIVCENVEVFTHGDMAYVVCNEVLPGHILVATNIFVQHGTQWKIIHHQAGPDQSTPGLDQPLSIH